jgi:4-amino-4-deoxy-L-arabinose transferase-like glycosyltransferase
MWSLIALTLAGLVLRLVYVVHYRYTLVGGDGFHYLASANLAERGLWFEFPVGGGPDAHHPPVWTVILSLAAKAGAQPQLGYQIVAVVIGTTTIPLVGLAGRKIAGARVGVVGAALAAVYPGLWKYERELLSEVVLMPLVAVVLLLAYRYRDAPSLPRAVVLSGTCAVLTLARAEQLMLFGLLVLPLVLATRTISWRSRIGWLAACAAVAGVIFAPWFLYNSTRFERPVFLSTGLGTTMASGACDATFSGDLLGHYEAQACTYQRRPLLSSSDRSVTDGEMREFAIDYTFDHLRRVPLVVLAREGRTFSLYRPLQEVRLGSKWSISPSWVGYAWTAMYWVLLPFAVAGAVLLRRRRTLLYPLLVEFVIVAISAATTFGMIRYRAGAEVPLLLLSAVAIDAVWRRLRRRSPARERESSETRDELEAIPT